MFSREYRSPDRPQLQPLANVSTPKKKSPDRQREFQSPNGKIPPLTTPTNTPRRIACGSDKKSPSNKSGRYRLALTPITTPPARTQLPPQQQQQALNAAVTVSPQIDPRSPRSSDELAAQLQFRPVRTISPEFLVDPLAKDVLIQHTRRAHDEIMAAGGPTGITTSSSHDDLKEIDIQAMENDDGDEEMDGKNNPERRVDGQLVKDSSGQVVEVLGTPEFHDDDEDNDDIVAGKQGHRRDCTCFQCCV